MSSGSTSGFEAKAHEASHSQSTTALTHTSSAHEGPVFLETSLEPMKPLRRTKRERDVPLTRQSFRRLRRQPIDPSLEQVSTKSEEEPRSRRRRQHRHNVETILMEVLPRTEGAVKLPEFDAAGPYARSDDVVLKMWRDETNWLMEIVNNPEKKIEFKSNGFLHGDTKEGYMSATNLSQRVLTAIAICLVDDECIRAKHCGQLSNRKKLSDLIDHLNKSQRTTETIAGMEDREARQQALHSQAATYSLVNYISVVLIRLMTGIPPGFSYRYFDGISILIRRTAKIKLLLLDLQANFAISVRAAKAVLSKMPESCDTQHPGGDFDHEEKCDEYLRMIETNEKDGIASYDETRVTVHCIKQTKYRFRFNSALRDMVMSVRFTSHLGLPATAFEISAIHHGAFPLSIQTVIHQDKDLEYSATSDLDNLRTANVAFHILNEIVVRLGQSREQGGCTSSIGTRLEWRHDGHDGQKVHEYLRLNYMDQVITVLIPLATTKPAFLATFTYFRYAMQVAPVGARNIRDGVHVVDYMGLGAFFCLTTDEFDDMVFHGLLGDHVMRRVILRLSQAVRAGFFDQGSALLLLTQWNNQVKLLEEAEQLKRRIYRCNAENRRIRQWVVDEKSVMVPCPGYVWSVIAVASLLVGAGLGIGFSVGERIHGVDPSHLATYLWVVAAFIVLIAKNMKVNEWTWNDFLRRRVRCCSVSQLQSITSIDGQTIITKLLYDERRGSVLNIRGPYNSVFLNRANEGFSIDEPIDSSTLINSGLLMLTVATARGYALVCLDFRTGTNLSVIGHTPDPQKEYLICEQIDDFEFGDQLRLIDVVVSGRPGRERKLAFSRSRGLKWKRVFGIYTVDGAKFI